VGFFDDMPLEDADDVRAAWHLVTWIQHWQRAHPAARPFMPAPDEVRDAMDRIQYTSVSLGLGLLPYPPARP
jgi:hypothetical protein